MNTLVIFTFSLLLVHTTSSAGNRGGELEDSIRNQSNGSPKSATILDDPKCGEIASYCIHFSENSDLLILECMQTIPPDRLMKIKIDCQHVIWSHMNALLADENVNRTLSQVCKLSDLPCSSGTANDDLFKCIVNNRDKVNDVDCLNNILRLERVAFQDYRWITKFLDHCTDEIKRLNCGRFNPQTLSQLDTVVCLQNNLAAVTNSCRAEVFKLSELQSESLKLDKQLFAACAEDYVRYCQEFTPSGGRAFTCLMDQSPENLSSGCKKNLLRRQKLIAQDYHVSKGLMRACREEIKKAMCRKKLSGDKTTRLAQVLLCLEGVVKNGTKIESQCRAEMVEHRRMLMSDYRLSPEIVDGCKEEIKKCPSTIETGGKTIHCLIKNAQSKDKLFGDVCRRALEALVEQTDVGENWSVDPVLHQACYPVVKLACRGVKGGDARVMSCLMDNIGADHMTDECEDALMEIQYFVARDFKLDQPLYKACRTDAEKLCHASDSWNDPAHPDPSYGPQVLPCLYRNAYHVDVDDAADEAPLNKACLQQIRRVMRQRAISVNLHPEIEEACLTDLAVYCKDKTKRGEEIVCLQNNFDELEDKCQDVIETYTEAQAEHADLNPYIMAHCRKEMESMCAAELRNDEGDVMECLISHKNDPTVRANPACRSSIEHFQIISLKNYRFTYKFKTACKNYLMRFCGHLKNKNDIFPCLSLKMTQDAIAGRRTDISKECRQQVKAQLFQQRENIDFDPKLKAACSSDIKQFCPKVQHGNAQVLECLQSVSQKLSETCEHELFRVKQQEMTDNTNDYALMTMCADSIQQYCPHHQKETILECLKMNRDQQGFDKKCRLVVMHRIIEQNSNYLLNPGLQENCKPDIKKLCFDIIQTNGGKDINDRVIKCLKSNFKFARLSHKCEQEMAAILRSQAQNINLNPLLKAVCKNELEYICKADDDDAGNVEECLKNALLNKKITSPKCQEEVASMITESEVDIQVDPILQEACSLDLLKLCGSVPQGSGRHIKCLRIILENNPNTLTPECKTMLNRRLEMYKNAAQYGPPQDLHELYNQVVLSPAKHYFFLMIIMVFGTVFVGGLFCGRKTKRHMLVKNK